MPNRSRPSIARVARPFALAAFAAFAGATCTPAHAQSARHQYVDAYEYFTTDAQFESWFTLRGRLAVDFDAICGDTFCEGDYSNIEPLSLRCSVERFTGIVGECAWVFAGSYEWVDPRAGAVHAQTATWTCVLPLAAGTPIDGLLDGLDVDSPLWAPLPGTSSTIYDGLIECL